MIYPKSPRFIFLHIAKAGGTSITKAIANHFGFNRDDYRPAEFKFLKIKDIINKPMIRMNWDLANIDSYYIFSCIRNPFSRLVSYFAYRKQIRKPPNRLPESLTFDNWVKDGGYKELTPMVDQLCIDGKVPNRINYIARLENIEKDWPFICAGLGHDIPMIHDKKSQHDEYRTYYTPEVRALIQDYYRKDLEIFGYEF